MKTHLDHLMFYVSDIQTRRVLDLGSGRGNFLVDAKSRGVNIVGLEMCEEYINFSHEKAKENGVEVDIHQGVAENLPFKNESFDFENICEVIEHVENPEKMLEEAYRVLSWRGKVYLSVPNRFGFKDQHFGLYFVNWFPRAWANGFISIFGKHKDYSGRFGRQNLTKMHYYTFGGIQRLVESKGFTVKDMRVEKLRARYPFIWFLLLPFYLVARTIYLDSFHVILTKKDRSILVVQSAKLGDMVCSTPVFRAIKEEYPRAELIVSGNSLNEEVLKGNSHVDKYVVLSSLTTENIKSLDVDTAILLNPNPGILWSLYKAGVRQVIVPKVKGGYSPYMTKKFKLLSLFATRVPHRMGYYAPQEYLNMLEPLGVETTDTRKEVFTTKDAESKIKQQLKSYGDKKLVAIAPGAGNKIKEWPPENFREVAKRLIFEYDAVVVLVGGEGDRGLSSVVKEGLPENSIFDTVGILSIDELKALVREMNLFIGVDTGPIYIAEAWGVPTIDMVGPVDENEQPPRGDNHRVVVAKRRGPELHLMNARVYDADEARSQVVRITPDMVIKTLDDLIKKIF